MGLCLNKKCKNEPLHLYSCFEEIIESIPVKSEVKYLGVTISKDSNTRELINIEERIDSMEKSLNQRLIWFMRDLSVMGGILLTKADGISKLIYPSYSLYVSPQLIKKANSVIFNFIWKNKLIKLKNPS